MVKYHPETRFLTDYSAGSLPEEQALCVATHLHYCAACRVKVRELTELGSLLFLQQSAPAQDAGAIDAGFEKLLAKVEGAGTGAGETAASVPGEVDTAADSSVSAVASSSAPPLPRALHKLAHGDIESLKWRRVGRSFRYTRLKVGNPQRETSLLHIRAGGAVPHHRHTGDEITVILSGSFSDQDDKYGVGDFIVRTAGEKHSPVASQDEDCLCLATLERPLVMSNLFYRLLAPFI